MTHHDHSFRGRWVLSATVACLALVSTLGCGFYDGMNSVTESKFATRDEQIQFLERFSPVPIPASARDIRFEMVQWMDWTLTCSFSASHADVFAIRELVAREPYRPERQIVNNRESSGFAYYDNAKREDVFIAVDTGNDKVLMRFSGK